MKKIAIALLLSLVATFGLTSCSKAKTDIKQAGQVFIDCSKADISQAVATDGTSLLGAVAQIILAGGDGWQAALEQIGKTVGEDALACATKAVESILVAHGDGSPTTSVSPAEARAIAFLQAHPSWKFASN